MSYATVAERYARAIFELGVESNQLAILVDQLQDFAQSYEESSELSSVLDNPLVDLAQREAVLNDVAGKVGLIGPALNAVRLLAQRHKLRVLPYVAKRLGEFADEHAGVVRATITSAVPLPESFYQKLQSTLEAATSRKFVLERQQDPTLIAGIVTRIGDNAIDGSIRGRLAEISRQLQTT